MKPIPRDDNGHPMLNRGTELFTSRLVDVSTSMLDVALPTDFKEVILHVESGTEALHVNGTVNGSSPARITTAGVNLTLPLCAPAGATVARIAAPSDTCNVSVFAWR
jgi:hypothetical protein